MYESMDIVRRVTPTVETHFQAPATPVISLLLHFDGLAGSTQFPDATRRHIIYASGNPQIDTTQSVFGGSSLLLTKATSDFLSIYQNGDFFYGLGDFTVDFWCRLVPTYDGSAAILWCNTRQSNFTIFIDSNANANKFRFFTAGANQITSTTSAVVSTWYHVAATRFSNSTRLFINGTQEGITYADNNNYTSSVTTFDALAPTIGVDGAHSSNFQGWIDELRVIKGSAAWTSNFQPPGSPYMVN